MKRVWVGIVLFFMALGAFGQTGALQGHSFLGGTSAVTSGLNSTNKLLGIIPSATITVYLTGTTTLATLYKDKNNTPLSNPFTSNALESVNPGGWIFFANSQAAYDVVGSGGIPPNTYQQPTPLLTDVYPTSAGGSGGVSGAGTADFATMWTGTASVGNAQSTDGTANVVYGVSGSALSVAFNLNNGAFDLSAYGGADFNLSGGASTGAFDVNTGSGGFAFTTSNNGSMDVDIDGNGSIDLNANSGTGAIDLNAGTSGVAINSKGYYSANAEPGVGNFFINGLNPVTAKTVAGTGEPTDACTATVNTFAIEVNAIPTAYQCSNATGSYAWNVIGGSGSMVYPSAGVPNSTGSAWGTSYQVGTGGNDLVQLNGSGALPSISGANLTVLPASASLYPTLNQNTTGNAATATSLAAAPTLCPGGEAAQGIQASGNATGCFTPSGAGVELETNGTANSSQTVLNLVNSSTNAAGLTLTQTNTSAGTVQGEIAGTLNAAHGGTGGDGTGYAYGNGTSAFSYSTTVPFGSLSGSASCAQLPALTGDATSTAGSCATTVGAIKGTSVPTLASGYLYYNGSAFAWQTPSGSGTVNAAAQYDVPYYSASGTANTLSGAAVSGFQFDSTTAPPAAATATNLGALADLAQYDVVVSSGVSAALAGIAPSSTSGVPLVSAGSAANPAFGTAAIAGGGTGATSASAALSNLLGNPAAAVYTVNCTSGTACSPQLTRWACEDGLNGGSTALPTSATGDISCYNGTGSTVTITAIYCLASASDSSTIAMTVAGNNILAASTETCGGGSFAGGSSWVSATNFTIPSGDSVTFTFTGGGTSKYTTWHIDGTY